MNNIEDYACLFLLFRKSSGGMPRAARHAQKMNGEPWLIEARLLPSGGARKAPTMEIVLDRPMAVPP